jgi:hypothetical protein
MDEQKFDALLDGQVPSIDDYAEFVDRLLCKPDAVAFVQLLAGQRRSEVGIALMDQRKTRACRSAGNSWLLGRPRRRDTSPTGPAAW